MVDLFSRIILFHYRHDWTQQLTDPGQLIHPVTLAGYLTEAKNTPDKRPTHRRTKSAWDSDFVDESPRHSSQRRSTSVEFFSMSFSSNFAPLTSSSRSTTNASAILFVVVDGGYQGNPPFNPKRPCALGVTWFCCGNWRHRSFGLFISYLAFTLRGWVSWPLFIFVFLASFSALWWPNICPKMGFLELCEITIGSIHFIPGIYPHGVSFLTPIHFHVPNLIFSPLVAKYLVENRVSGTFWKNNWFHSKFSWRIPTCVAHNCRIEIFIGYFWMTWVVIRAGYIVPIYGHSLFG